MKKVGRTEDGCILVAMSEREVKNFDALNKAVTGEFYYWSANQDFRQEYFETIDLSDAFSAIKAWISVKFKVNELEKITKELQKLLSDN